VSIYGRIDLFGFVTQVETLFHQGIAIAYKLHGKMVETRRRCSHFEGFSGRSFGRNQDGLGHTANRIVGVGGHLYNQVTLYLPGIGIGHICSKCHSIVTEKDKIFVGHLIVHCQSVGSLGSSNG